MKIPFFKPDITDAEIECVVNVLKSGWIVTGLVNQELCDLLTDYCQTDNAVLVDSATAGLEMALRYFGIKKGDEVITTPYTYAATAHVIKYCQATPVFVDIDPFDFSISIENIKNKINEKTKAIISVDFAGFPVQYQAILDLLNEFKPLFKASNPTQEHLQRPLFVSDAAHSLGSLYQQKRVGSQADITVFSFHAVKNITTAEGGAIVFNNHDGIDGNDLKQWLKLWIQHGQSKTALEKQEQGSWFYDIKVAGYRHNLPDVLAAIGLSQLKRYKESLQDRLNMMRQYQTLLHNDDLFINPIFEDDLRQSNGHFYPLRLKNSSYRNRLVEDLATDYGIATNVHFIPLPMHTAYKDSYDIKDYPNALKSYEAEISLPVYPTLSTQDIAYIAESLCTLVKKYE